ncbi:MAG: NUDIX domain-containing protein [Patescibacteria group bacterium]|nr:NUDIX domain-containing protein [Patescibacteria group bacterium]
MKEISAGIIVYRHTPDGLKFLILYHGNNYWNFPKGRIESEEKSFQTAVREIREETGLLRSDLKFSDYFKVHEKFIFWGTRENEKVKIFKIVIFYLAETKKRQIIISGKHEEGYGWFTYREALKILEKHKDSQRLLNQAHNFLKKIGAVKSTHGPNVNWKNKHRLQNLNKPKIPYGNLQHKNTPEAQ